MAIRGVLRQALGIGVGHESGSQQAEADTHRTVPPWLIREVLAKNDDGDRKALRQRRDFTDPSVCCIQSEPVSTGRSRGSRLRAVNQQGNRLTRLQSGCTMPTGPPRVSGPV